MTKSVSGERLRRARYLKKYSLKTLADKCGVVVATIQRWQQKNGVPEKKVSLVASLFGVEEWVFTDVGLANEDFEKIIFNPQLMKTFRPETVIYDDISEISQQDIEAQLPEPLMSFKAKYDFIKGMDHESQPFMIDKAKVVIVAKLWGAKGSGKAVVQLKRSIDTILEQTENLSRIEITVDAESALPYVKRDEIEIGATGIYYLKVHSNYNFEIKIYEVNW